MIGCFELDALIRDKAIVSRRMLARAVDMAVLVLPSALAFVALKPKPQTAVISNSICSTPGTTVWVLRSRRLRRAGLHHSWCSRASLGRRIWRGWIKLHPSMRTVVVVLLVCVAFMPEWALGGWGVDLRMPAVLGAVAFSSVELRLPERWQIALAAAAMAALAFCAAGAGGNWAYYDRQYAEFRGALRDSPTGTRMMAALDGDAMGLGLRRALLAHGGIRDPRSRRLLAASVHDGGPACRARAAGIPVRCGGDGAAGFAAGRG